ncbi:uncharacterized protein LOC127803157 isoform X3 [Diospyros lotus]|uniref:uncharacterized protein LOC127803157 isoform X3 n=1 Tax=Diospyros lotus TaxID=55363 RepID=UPI00224E58FB|nr:uncharacterized protein LOC127803157 isoform X3 [Diospyros lotus]
MDPKHTVEILRHLEKQHDHLMDAYRSMTHELHKLQVEEEMLMRKFYELMVAKGLNKKAANLESFVSIGIRIKGQFGSPKFGGGRLGRAVFGQIERLLVIFSDQEGYHWDRLRERSSLVSSLQFFGVPSPEKMIGGIFSIF